MTFRIVDLVVVCCGLTLQAANAQTQNIIDVDELDSFYAIARYDEKSKNFHATFSDRQPSPKINKFRMWGLEISEPEAAMKFLSQRAVHCLILFEDQELLTVDCEAAPTRNDQDIFSGSTINWISLYEWLPEFNLAKRKCSEADRLNRIHAKNPRMAFLCKKTMIPTRSTVLEQ